MGHSDKTKANECRLGGEGEDVGAALCFGYTRPVFYCTSTALPKLRGYIEVPILSTPSL